MVEFPWPWKGITVMMRLSKEAGTMTMYGRDSGWVSFRCDGKKPAGRAGYQKGDVNVYVDGARASVELGDGDLTTITETHTVYTVNDMAKLEEAVSKFMRCKCHRAPAMVSEECE